MNELKHYGIKGMVWKNRKTKTTPPIENPLKNNNIDYRHPNVKTKGKPSFKRFEAKYFSNGAEKFVASSKKNS